MCGFYSRHNRLKRIQYFDAYPKFQFNLKKFRKIDTITSIFRKIQTLIKFERFIRFRLNLKTKLLRIYLQL